MQIIERTVHDITVLELDHDLALDSNSQFRKKANAAFDAGTRKLIVNLANVTYMDSCGMGELISCYTRLKKMGGRFALLHLNQRLQHLLTITKLHLVFEVFESEAEAVASFTEPAESETTSHANSTCLP